ncbi:MAG: elongation factor 1-beta [Candidatus Altiarchaeota archaeon]
MTDWNVVAKIKIMPESVETNLEAIQQELEKIVGEKAKIHSMQVKPIAFGLKALEANILFNDKQGGFEELEEKIRKIKGAGEVETTDINRL